MFWSNTGMTINCESHVGVVCWDVSNTLPCFAEPELRDFSQRSANWRRGTPDVTSDLEYQECDTESELLPLRLKMMNMDFAGAALLIEAMTFSLLALQWAGVALPWSSATVIGLLVGFTLISVLFAFTEVMFGEKGTISPRVLCQRSVLMGCFFAFFLNKTLYIVRVRVDFRLSPRPRRQN